MENSQSDDTQVTNDRHVRSAFSAVASKAAFVRSARKQVAVIQSHFYDIRSDIIRSVAVGRIKISDQLQDMQQTTEACQRDVESRMDALRKSNVDEWQDLKASVENSIDAYRRTVTALASAATAKRD